MRCLLFFFLSSFSGVFAQNPLHHQMLSAQGTSGVLSNGLYVSQTIGQQSVIGTYTVDGKTYGQGFQQSLWSKYISSSVNNTITTITYPNPFISSINFQFSQPIKETISVALFDVRGRLVYSENKNALDNILTLELPNLASSNYLVRLTSNNYTYYTQILKQE
jgi:hypothetical protein